MISDHDLCLAAQSGDSQAADQLVRRYTGFAYSLADGFYLQGAEHADLRQEALIGLYLAGVAYRADSGVPFMSFAKVVVGRKVAQAITSANRVKHHPLTKACREVSLAGSDGFDHVDSVSLIPDLTPGPDEQAETHEQLNMLVAQVRRLSPLERHSLLGIANGHSYTGLAETAGVSTKAIDNATQRARIKLRTLLEAA